MFVVLGQLRACVWYQTKSTLPLVETGRVPGCLVDVEKAERVQAPANVSALGASLAHEINNPLDSLLNLLYLIEAEATPTGRHYLALAEEEVHRISQIAHGAMDRSRSPVGPQDTNVPRLLGSVVDFYMSRLDSLSIRVETRYCSGEDPPVDPGALRQVFSNLLLNAAHAMPGGGKMHVRVSMALEWTGLGRRGLRVTFADNGCGIAAADLSRITEPFFTTKGTAGTGLGLALVKDTVEKHHGVLRVRSSTKLGGSGSVFAIFLLRA
jgi:signal transduction histidine kinase